MSVFFTSDDLEKMDEEFDRELKIIEEEGFSANPFRRDYVEKISRLEDRAKELEETGLSDEEIAHAVYDERRELAKDYRESEPPLIREYTNYKSNQKYGDPIGPSYEQLYEKKHSYRKIIEGAWRPSDHLEERFTVDDFKSWYMERRER
ncbi:MAG: hypothetical protein LKG40_02785 [Lachnospiraceae bacterium]|jgi:vacuolar-type H+-ATPase subunit I/STV1|nr:hypothetical protein [Lachnospiraceae bacterium]MCI1327702.1 hypothetical protein [Lachnospiraceae bacterium]